MVLAFSMQQQEQDNWCWAACAASTALYYDSSSSWTQCAVANGELGFSNCCDDPVPPACDVYGYLDQALIVVGHFSTMHSSQAPETAVYTEVDADRPRGIRVAWSGGGAHFVICTGDDGRGTVTVSDPFYGTSVIPYATLQGSYQGSGVWTHTYFTRP